MKKSKKILRRDIISRMDIINSLLQSGWHSYDEILTKIEDLGQGTLTIRTIQSYFTRIRESMPGSEITEEMQDKFSDAWNDKKGVWEVIEERSRGKKKEFKFLDGFKLAEDKLGSRIINKIIPFIEFIRQRQGIDNNFEEVIETMEDLIDNEGFTLPEEKKDIIRIDTKLVYNLNNIQTVQEFLPTLRKAIQKNITIEFKYKPFNKRTSTLIIHPYKIIEHNNRWSIIGLLEKAKEKNTIFKEQNRIGKLNNFSFDRIIEDSINLLTDFEFKYTKIRIDEILDNSIGPSIGNWEDGLKKREEIILKISDSLSPYFLTKPLHHFQKVDKTKRLFSYQLIPTIELEQVILSYGDEITVLKPESLKKRIKTRIINMKNSY